MFQRIFVALCVLVNVGVARAAEDDFIAALKLQRVESKAGQFHLAPEFAKDPDAFVVGAERLVRDLESDAKRAEANLARLPRVQEIMNEILGFTPTEEQSRKQADTLRRFSSVPLRFGPADKLKIFVIEQESAKTYIRGGGKIPRVRYDAKSDRVIYDFSVALPVKAGEPVPAAPTIDWLVIPLRGVDPKKWKELEAPRRPAYAYAICAAATSTVINSNMMFKFTSGFDHRWFGDGLGVAVAMRVLRKLGDDDELAALKADIAPDGHEPLKQDADLAHWLSSPMGIGSALGHDNPVAREHQIMSARLAFAYVEIDRLIEKHGEDGLRRILKNLAARGRVRTPDFYAAIKEETGEDMKLRLRAYQRYETVEDGIKHYSTLFAAAREKDDHEAALLALSRLLELRSKGVYDGQIYAVAAGFYRRMGKPEAGAKLMRKQLTFVRENIPEVADGLAQAFIDYAFDCEDIAMVDDVAAELAARFPDHGAAIIVLADAAVRAGDLNRARAELAKLAKLKNATFPRKYVTVVQALTKRVNQDK